MSYEDASLEESLEGTPDGHFQDDLGGYVRPEWSEKSKGKYVPAEPPAKRPEKENYDDLGAAER